MLTLRYVHIKTSNPQIDGEKLYLVKATDGQIFTSVAHETERGDTYFCSYKRGFPACFLSPLDGEAGVAELYEIVEYK